MEIKKERQACDTIKDVKKTNFAGGGNKRAQEGMVMRLEEGERNDKQQGNIAGKEAL
ncbi:MAG: hypothetical protein UIJ87_02155 [Anaerovoracaceae bacterium]|nr:hypothetical protein [Anaerovoracaceae bacterium]